MENPPAASPGESSKRPRSISPVNNATGASGTSGASGANEQPPAKKLAIDDEEAQVNIPGSGGKDHRGNGNTAGRGGRGRGGGRGGIRGRGGKGGADYNKREFKPWKGKDYSAVAPKKDRSEGAEGKEGEQEDGEGDVDADGKKRLPKKRVAILLGYCGTGYSGMQIQPHESKTIEGEFFEALVKAGAVSPENSDDHRKVDVQRAARTDAGVHAAGNCISMKMILAPPLPEDHKTLASYVNTFLPDQIRMWGFVRTMKSFAARTACDSRIYEYLLPSYCLLPPASDTALAQAMDSSSPGWRAALGSPADFADAGIPSAEESEGKLDPKTRGEYERRRSWRVDQETLTRFRALVAMFKGTHNFHNYTLGKPFNDRTVKRYMMSLEVKEPQVVGEIEWISVQIHGQSFMLHQIRKMMSLAMLACRTGSPPSLLPETFGPKRIHIPKAPPLGLLLEAPQFGMYNKRVSGTANGQGERDVINWNLYAEEIKAFKLKYIYDKLRQDELESNIFQKWIKQMDNSDPNILAFLNTNGVIPPEAEVSKNREKEKALEKEEASEDEEVDQELLKAGELEG